MTESQNNKSFVPLLAGRVYIGSYDTVSPYATATISLLSDTSCSLVAYQSQNKVQYSTTTYTTIGGVPFSAQLNLTDPFCYFTVRNSSVTDGTLMAFTVIYRVGQIIPPIVIPQEPRGTASLWNGSAFTAVNLSQLSVSTLSIFGNMAGGTTVLDVLYSNDGTTWFQSQYSYPITGISGGPFGFNISGCPYYLKLGSTNTFSGSAFLNYS